MFSFIKETASKDVIVFDTKMSVVNDMCRLDFQTIEDHNKATYFPNLFLFYGNISFCPDQQEKNSSKMYYYVH